MPGWEPLKRLVGHEFTQGREEGKSAAALEALRPEFEAAGDDKSALEAVFDRLLALPVEPGFRHHEPDDIESIRASRPEPGAVLPKLTTNRKELMDRLLGAWLGRCAGCALGKPVEGMGLRTVEGFQNWEILRRYLVAISPQEWPLRDYVPGHSPAETDNDVGKAWCPASTREHIAFMETDDDIRYTVLGLILLREKGENFRSWDVACNWIRRLSYSHVCTAETQAYRNLVSACDFHIGSDWGKDVQDVDWGWVATHLNPYREWIGAQIRVDAYGYAAAGNPELAAGLAWRDARISHVKNGIYGAMFCAAMIAAAFVSDDPRRIVDEGLDQIPSGSRLAEAIRRTVSIVEEHGGEAARFEEILAGIHREFGAYSPVHTIPNAAVCAMAVLLSNGDLHQGITLAVMGGWDTDCNGATVGSIVGAMTGAANSPSHWTGRLNDTLHSEICGYDPVPISECARQTLAVVQALNA